MPHAARHAELARDVPRSVAFGALRSELDDDARAAERGGCVDHIDETPFLWPCRLAFRVGARQVRHAAAGGIEQALPFRQRGIVGWDVVAAVLGGEHGTFSGDFSQRRERSIRFGIENERPAVLAHAVFRGVRADTADGEETWLRVEADVVPIGADHDGCNARPIAPEVLYVA